VARELFRRTRVKSVRAVTDARNLASIALLERLGFRRASEQQAMFRGEPCVEYVYVLASSEVVSR
jgi:RimJ/RimL family protein N-acetyltransferase